MHDSRNDVDRASLNVQSECLRASDATMERIEIFIRSSKARKTEREKESYE